MSKLGRFLRAAILAGAATVLASAPTRAGSEIVVTHWSALLYGVPYAVAQAKGYFKEEGVDITGILSSKGGGTSVRNLMAGETLYAEVALPAALAAIKEGFPIRIVNAGTDGSSGIYITREGEKIDRPEDLKGKRFAYSRPKSVSESGVLAALTSHGLKASDAKLIAAGDIGAGITALEHNKVDIAIIPEPIFSTKMKDGAKYKPLPWLGKDVPRYTQTVGIATIETIEKRGKELAALIKARRRGVEFLYANPDETVQILAKAYNMPLDIATKAMTNIKAQTPSWWNPGRLDYEGMSNMAEALASVGALELPIDWKKAVDDRFVPPDLKAMR
ncbi:ABC transporter substrate-binding protein [Vineibacter terrae]|uniref:ABC transporter substrate-binding protein n=1 Tax=Vineibacter terrae TaxID=2586908 RepID=UPI002E2FA179|nr:ABC transporter substrate-binding protein [Vineibacter terrae]HEX2886983.1 ABC transporter substrate-binding protein [Vineibacter terrae]